MTAMPVNLSQVLASFSDIYSPRIIGRVNDYDVKVAHAHGEHLWHVHEHTDEFFLVIDGQFGIALREPDGQERTVELHAGDVFVVPKGVEHKPSSPGGAPDGKWHGLGQTIAALRPHGMLIVDDMTPMPDWPATQQAIQNRVRQVLLTAPHLISTELTHGSGVILSTRR
jgi:mannose-6-phosphate isomerase-like protein (cupin superfamily)